jgi:hypothetical protein
MAEAKTYQGGCHCGRVRFKATTDLARVVSCNCSRCHKIGAHFTFVPTDQFELLSGEGALTDYQFNTRNIHHVFCSTCGVESFARGTAPNGQEVVAINARCIDDLDLGALTLTFFDGKSI